ncbi:insertion sequence IS2A uncharacterized 48.2 kDa protein [Ochrobactrum sp. CDB2]|uniref:Uncharacterized protein n=1 Tax=Brucella pseudogrignonensis TaxID=419475 RepID=A0A256G608_9HYPH|nr:insertion sequence IS2A uncharacterized 48.2 kDa protein [Ochrobactrum sp. CDB2]OYR22557.1 hypothetical protein CEV34_4389 [Brucella pseudogrignonensis]
MESGGKLSSSAASFHKIYNELRPHGAIGNKMPISLINGSTASPPL